MARARNIKPGFYKNPELVECSVWARLIFPGLWMLADREGRLEDRPKQIKMELLPADAQDMEPLLCELEAHGFLVRYQIDGASFIQISKFSQHQSPHFSEKPSRIKPPNSGNIDSSSVCHSKKQTALKDGENARTPKAQPPDSPNPSSLNPDSLPSGVAPAKAVAPRSSKKCPLDFAVTAELRAWVAKETPGVDIDRETAKLRDHTFSAARTDWPGTWRNWMRKAADTPSRSASPASFRERDAAVASARVHEMTGGILGKAATPQPATEALDGLTRLVG